MDLCQRFPGSKRSKFDGKFKSGAIALELGQIERDGIADLASPDLRVPRRRHEHLWRELDIEGRSQYDRVAGEGRQIGRVIMPEIPDFAAQHDIRGNSFCNDTATT